MKERLPSFPSCARALPTRLVLNLPVVDATAHAAVAALLNKGRHTVFFLNAHCANLRARDPAYAKALTRATVLPDGIGVALAARMTGERLTANLNGTDLTPLLLSEAASRGMSVFLFGASPGTAERAAQRLRQDIEGLRIAGTRDGYDGAKAPAEVVAEINRSGADIVLVAMGVPKQELWIDRHRTELNADLVLGVGALFDFLAGNVTRAPAWVRAAHMEWAWRLMLEPRRLAGRYIIGNASFLARATAHAIRTATSRAALSSTVHPK